MLAGASAVSRRDGGLQRPAARRPRPRRSWPRPSRPAASPGCRDAVGHAHRAGGGDAPRLADVAPFGRRLAAAVADRGPLCVGIDPHRSLLIDWGVGDDLDGCAGSPTPSSRRWPARSPSSSRRWRSTSGSAPAASPCSRTPSPRSAAAGALVLLDAKRGDIGSTMDAYADYLRSDHPLQVDAITVSPYLGPESLEPARSTAAALRRRAVRARPHVEPRRRDLPARATAEAGAVGRAGRRRHRARLEHRRLVVGDPMPAIAAVRDLASRWGRSTGSFGVVVGATLPELDVDLDGLGGPILAPGLGAQGGRRPTCAGCSAAAAPSSPPSPGACSAPGRTGRAAGRRRPVDGGADRAEPAGWLGWTVPSATSAVPACRAPACRARRVAAYDSIRNASVRERV